MVKKKTEEQLKDDKKDSEVASVISKDDKTIKNTNKIIWILAGIFSVLLVVLLSVFFVVPYFTKIPDIKVPDVSKLTVVEAEEKLKKAGFEVGLETIKEENEEIEKGKVIKTEPQAERSIKKGSVITIYESLGKETYKIEDYKGSNYIEIKTELEKVYGLEVTIEKKDVDTIDEYNEQEIIDQSIAPGTVVAKGDSITLYIPNTIDGYPNMVDDGWTVEDVEAFCTKYSITLKIDYEETTQYEEGTLISQSRSPKTPVVKGSNLKIVVAKKPEISPTPTPTETPEVNNNETETNNQ